MDDFISRQVAIKAVENLQDCYNGFSDTYDKACIIGVLEELPSAEPEIIRCKDCKHWTQSTGKMKGCGLGRCDFHDADLVTCNGFCYWAEGRTDE